MGCPLCAAYEPGRVEYHNIVGLLSLDQTEVYARGWVGGARGWMSTKQLVIGLCTSQLVTACVRACVRALGVHPPRTDCIPFLALVFLTQR
jgi:hypothetical protein